MVFCAPAAAVGVAANAAATGTGLGLAQTQNDLANSIFLKQMMQAKRFFTAQMAQASYQNSENMAQAAQQHSQGQALGMMSYYQSEKMNSQQIRLSMLQDERAYEMQWRSVVRDMIRDELENRLNQYDALLLVDAIAIGFVYALVNPDGALPDDFIETQPRAINIYIILLAIQVILFTYSMWLCIILRRRLSSNSAASLELQFFATSKEIRQHWENDLTFGVPSGQRLMCIVAAENQKWFDENITKKGTKAFALMTVGFLVTCICAGICIAGVYGRGTVIARDNNGQIIWAMHYVFWIASALLMALIFVSWIREDSYERKGLHAYEKSWMDYQDQAGADAKINLYTEELNNDQMQRLGSLERCEKYRDKELVERKYVARPEHIHKLAESLRKQADLRLQIRQLTLASLTSATEELDTLPDDLIGQMHSVLLEMDEVDRETSKLVTAPVKYMTGVRNPNQFDGFDCSSTVGSGQLDGFDDAIPVNISGGKSFYVTGESGLKTRKPTDAGGQAINFKALRTKLGDIAITSIIRIRNTSDVPFRLKNGLTLKAGAYVKDLLVNIYDDDGSRYRETYHLFPILELLPHSEVVIAARSKGPALLPTSGIDGELEYQTKAGTHTFRISFTNDLFNGAATSCNIASKYEDQENFKIVQETVDSKRNSEVVITIEQGLLHRKSRVSLFARGSTRPSSRRNTHATPGGMSYLINSGNSALSGDTPVSASYVEQSINKYSNDLGKVIEEPDYNHNEEKNGSKFEESV